jgi:pilus assembly protein Flp/PilA
LVEPIPYFILFESNRSLLSDLSRDESGQDLIEYALLAGVLALGAIAGTNNLAATVANNVNHIANAVTNIFPAAPPADDDEGHGHGHG